MILQVRLYKLIIGKAECEVTCGLCSRDDKKCMDEGAIKYIAKMDFAVPNADGRRISDASGNNNILEIDINNKPPIL